MYITLTGRLSYQYTKFFLLILFLLFYSACTPYESGETSFSSAERQAVSKKAFEESLYLGLRQHCSQCHGTVQHPLFAEAKPSKTHDLILEKELVDFSNPEDSYFLLKLSLGHNNFSAEIQNSIRSKIKTWVAAVNKYDSERPQKDDPKLPIFAPAKAPSILSKIKYLSHGGAVTEQEWDELADSINDKEKLKSKIEEWINTPEGEAKLMFFFTNAFNQDIQLGTDSRMVLNVSSLNYTRRFEQSLRESFARTALDIVKKGEPFTKVNETRRFAVNTALLSSYAFMERGPGNFNAFRNQLRNDMKGSDYDDWRFITFNESANKSTILYSNLDHWRAVPDGATVSLAIPRVGFFSTLAFQGKYPSNEDNQFRVITNQTLIAGLGRTFSPSDTTYQPELIHIDNDHAPQNTQCFACHRIMDPMRMVFQKKMDYTYKYNPDYANLNASFAFFDYISPLNHLTDLGKALSNHPDFSKAWTQKLCVALNSAKCVESDPEFLRLASVFENSNFNFKTLYKELLTSDLFTGLNPTATTKSLGFDVYRSRETHLCQSLNARQRQIQKARGVAVASFDNGRTICDKHVKAITSALGDDHTVRGETDVINSFDTDTFSRQGIEATCKKLAEYFLEYSSRLIETDVDNLNENVDLLTKYYIGLPVQHPRHSLIKDSIFKIYDHSINELNMGHKEAFNEAFMFACTTPDFMGMGL